MYSYMYCSWAWLACELFSFQILYFLKCLFFYELFYEVFYCCSIHIYLFIFFYCLFIFFYHLCIVPIFFVVVCCKVWTLGVWGELACHKRLFNPPPQFSRLGTWCPTFLCASVLFVLCVYLDGGMGGGG